MKEAQQWLNEKYPLNQRRQIEEINNSYGEELTGKLIIEDFPNLRKIHLAKNKSINQLIIRSCPQIKKVDVSKNQITKLVINELTNLECLNCSDNQLTELNVNQNIKIKELFFSGNFRLREESVKGLEKLTQLISFKCDENLQFIQILQDQLQRTQQRVNNSSQTEFIQLQQLNQELTVQIQELQEKLASFEILSLEEKLRIQSNYMERLKTNARSRLEILDDLLEAQKVIVQGDNWFAQRLLDRSKQDLSNNNRLTEQEINKLLRARIKLTRLEMQQAQEQQALIVVASE